MSTARCGEAKTPKKRDMKKELEQWKAEKEAREAAKNVNKEEPPRSFRRSHVSAPRADADKDLNLESAIESMETGIDASRKVRAGFGTPQRVTTSMTASRCSNRADTTKGGKLPHAPKQRTSLSGPSTGLESTMQNVRSVADLNGRVEKEPPSVAEDSADLKAYLPPESPPRGVSPSPGRQSVHASSMCSPISWVENNLLPGAARGLVPSPGRQHSPHYRVLSPASEVSWIDRPERSWVESLRFDPSPRQRQHSISPGRRESSPVLQNKLNKVASIGQKKPVAVVDSDANRENSSLNIRAANKELSLVLQQRRRIVDQQCSEAEKTRPSPCRQPLVELDSNSGSPCEKPGSKTEIPKPLNAKEDVQETLNASSLLSAYEEAYSDAQVLPRPPVNSPEDLRGANLRVQSKRKARNLAEALREVLGDLVGHRETQEEQVEQTDELRQPDEAEPKPEAWQAQATTQCETPSDKQSEKTCRSWSSGKVSLLSIDGESASPSPGPAGQSPRRKLEQTFEDQGQSVLHKMCEHLQQSAAIQDKRRSQEHSSANAHAEKADEARCEASASSYHSQSPMNLKEKLSRHQILWTEKPVLGTDDHLSRAWSIEEFWFFEMRDRVPVDKRPIPEQLEEIPEHPPDWPGWKTQSYDSREAMRRDKDARRSKSLSGFW